MKARNRRPLPQGWSWQVIGEHIAESRSGIARGDKSRTSGFPHLRMNNISNELRLNFDELWRIPATEGEVVDYSLKERDILFNNTNSRDLVGKTCLFQPPNEETYLFSNHISRIRTKPSLAPEYLVFWINHLWLQGFFKDKADVWVNQAAIRVEDVLSPTRIPMPEKPEEQLKMAKYLEANASTIESLRKAAERQLEAIRTLKTARLRDFFSFTGDVNA